MNHNAIGRGYETFGNATAETVDRDVGDDATSREWYRPAPAPSRFRWSMRDNVNYQQTAALAILDNVAGDAEGVPAPLLSHGLELLAEGCGGQAVRVRDPRRPGRPPARGRARQPAARATDRGGGPAGAAGGGRRALRRGQLRRAPRPAVPQLRGRPADPPGLPVRCRRTCPTTTCPGRCPLHFGVRAVRVDDPRVRDAALDPVTADVAIEARVVSAGPVFLLADRGQEALLAARHRLARLSRRDRGGGVHGRRRGLRRRLLDPARAGGARGGRARRRPGAGARLHRRGRRPRRAAPRRARGRASASSCPGPTPTPSAGSAYVLDSARVPYVYLRDEDLRAGNLREKVDVIVYGHVRLDLAAQIHGIEPVAGPMPFEATPEFPSLGKPAGLARHHRRPRLRRPPRPGGVRPRGRHPRDARQRLDPGPRRRADPPRARGRASDLRTPGRAPARALPPRGPSHRLRLPRGDRRLPLQLHRLRDAAPLVGDGLLHVVPRRAGRPRAASSSSGAARGRSSPAGAGGTPRPWPDIPPSSKARWGRGGWWRSTSTPSTAA